MNRRSPLDRHPMTTGRVVLVLLVLAAVATLIADIVQPPL
jgi:hypothetical protein